MKILLGDNQFFGINHYDLQKGNLTKEKFINKNDIHDFIKETQSMGLDGFMINSNQLGYEIVKDYQLEKNKEIHYSIPYPHKYASLVNEKGMLYLLKYFLLNTSFWNFIVTLPKFLFTKNVKHLISLVTSLEVPKSLPKGSTVYIQNVVTDMIIGMKRFDILEAFTKDVRKRGYKPGLITLNPIKLDELLRESELMNTNDLTVCFNINHAGFNVFPNKELVENFIRGHHNYNLMGMSIFSSGGANINEAIKYIKSLNLDYVVFGSSKLENIENNFKKLKK